MSNLMKLIWSSMRYSPTMRSNAPKQIKAETNITIKYRRGFDFYDFVFVTQNQQQKLRYNCNYYVDIPMFKHCLFDFEVFLLDANLRKNYSWQRRKFTFNEPLRVLKLRLC